MTPNETPEQSVKKPVPMSFILAAVAAILLLMAIFFTNGSTSKTTAGANPETKMAEDMKVVATNLLLHKQFSGLQKLDEEFNVMVFNNESQGAMDSLNGLIEKKERLLLSSIDSIKTNKQKYNAWANVVMIDSLTNTFTDALANRKYLADIKRSLDGKTINMGTEQKEIMQLETDVRDKQNQIVSLENLLKSRPVTENVREPSASVKEMETSLQEEEMRNAGLLDIITELKNDNAKLVAENKSKKTDQSSQSDAAVTAKNKMANLKEEINDLNAELSFARIDCNLSRADAKKIISNSKQRMQLLEEALKNLQTLSGSDNQAVKRKAKEKLAELNSIASTVRD